MGVYKILRYASILKSMELKDLIKIKGSKKLQAIEWKNCKDDPYYWLTTWARTLDVHGEGTNKVNPFPKKDYIKYVVDRWLKERILLVVKSRQMMATWLFVGLYLWDTQFHAGKLTFFQSKKEDDADDLIKRAKFIWDNQPDFLKAYHNGSKLVPLICNPQHNGQHVYCKLTFPEIYSEIRGIPQGGDVIRMHTASGILSDEIGFQPEAKAAYTAARPTISSKGRFTGVSTAEDNTFFEKLVYDKIEI